MLRFARVFDANAVDGWYLVLTYGRLVCAFQRRFDPEFQRLFECVRNGDIGRIQTIHVTFRDHPMPPLEFLKSGGDPFHDLGVHDIDFVRQLLKENPVEVFGAGSTLHPDLKSANVMQFAHIFLRFPSGALVWCVCDLPCIHECYRSYLFF